MAVVHLFCTVILVGIGHNWGDCNTNLEVNMPLSTKHVMDQEREQLPASDENLENAALERRPTVPQKNAP